MQPIILDEQIEPPLCVDLDGTLVRTDTLHESLLSLVRADPLLLFLLPFWLLSGRAGFKRQVARRVSLDAAALPYNQEFLEYLQSCHKSGRKLILVTAADESIARGVADHLGIFSSVLASSPEANLMGGLHDRGVQCERLHREGSPPPFRGNGIPLARRLAARDRESHPI